MLVRTQKTTILIDCGFTLKETNKRLKRLGVSPQSIDGVLVTHEHSDHISGVGSLSRKYNLPVWMSHGTHRKSKVGDIKQLNLIPHYSDFTVGDIDVSPFPVPHDCAEPTQYVFSADAYRCGLITDAGKVTSHMVKQLSECDGIVLEFNHDIEMLQSGPYPYQLKKRVSSDYGHLNNYQSASLLQQIKHHSLKHVIAAHISEKNNCTERVSNILKDSLADSPTRYQIAMQNTETDWIELTSS